MFKTVQLHICPDWVNMHQDEEEEKHFLHRCNVYCVAFNHIMVLSVSKGQTQLSYNMIHGGQAEDLVISH